MTNLAIETHNLRKEYGSKAAVQDLTLSVPQGEVFGFLGPNGAGKSTTVKMLLGLVKPTSGELKVLGQSVDQSSARAKIGFLPEHFRFHEWLKASEFLAFHGKLYGMSKEALNQRIPQLLELVKLSDSAGEKIGGYSKGMLQRIGLAQAMLNNPALIFLDEPTSGLDPLGRRLVRDIIRKLKQEGTTVFLNSHLLSEVEITCDRVAFINHGRVVKMDSMENLMSQTTEVTLRLDAIPPALLTTLDKLGSNINPNGASLSMTVDEREKVPQIAEAVYRHGAKLYELKPRQKSLEEIFVAIIEEEEVNDGGRRTGNG